MILFGLPPIVVMAAIIAVSIVGIVAAWPDRN